MSRDMITQIDRTINTPLHAQLKDAIKHEILAGVLNVGDQIPSDREISKIYNVSRITARRALTDLEADGLLIKIQGKGTFVAERQSKSDLTYALGVGLYEASYMYQPSFSMIVSGMAEVAAQDGFNIQLIVTNDAPECGGKSLYERVLEQRRVDGLALIDHAVSDEEIVSLHDCGVPIVMFDRVVPGHDLKSVLQDNRGGIFQLVEYLYALGHRDICFVTPSLNNGHSLPRERYEGYRSAINILGLELRPEWVLQYLDFDSSIDSILTSLLNSKRIPTALVCAEDLSAIRTQDLLRKYGYRVPEDFSVVGFDNIPQSSCCVPPITTIDSGLVNMGREMANLLIAEVLNRPITQSLQASRAQLIVRESAGPVSA